MVSFRREHLREALRLSRELGELQAGSAEQIAHLMQGVARIVGAVQSTLSRVEVGHAIRNIGAWGWTRDELALADRVYAGCDGSIIDPLARALIVERSQSSAYARRDVVGDSAWYSSPSYSELRKPVGIDDAIYTKTVIAPRVFATLAVCRAPGDRPFTAEDRNIIHLLSDENSFLCRPTVGTARPRKQLGREQRQWMKSLPPRLVRIVELLWSGLSEKQIAERAGLSHSTTHQYIVEIYRRAGVHSRAELMASALGWHVGR